MYYLTRERRKGDLHGQAPVLWTATALLRWIASQPFIGTYPAAPGPTATTK